MRSTSILGLGAMLLFALSSCTSSPPPAPVEQPAPVMEPEPEPEAEPEAAPVPSGPSVEELQSQIARLQIQLLERDAQIADSQEQLEATRQEVVRAMAKLQSQASRAEAASGIAEAEIALQALGRTGPGQGLPEFSQAGNLLAESSVQFDDDNYGGSLYLATQARALARGGQSRLPSGDGTSMVAGETLFALAIPLQTTSRSNVRDGPGLSFAVLFTLDASVAVEGQSYSGEWVRVTDEEGRRGWIFHTLVTGR